MYISIYTRVHAHPHTPTRTHLQRRNTGFTHEMSLPDYHQCPTLPKQYFQPLTTHHIIHRISIPSPLPPLSSPHHLSLLIRRGKCGSSSTGRRRCCRRKARAVQHQIKERDISLLQHSSRRHTICPPLPALTHPTSSLARCCAPLRLDTLENVFCR